MKKKKASSTPRRSCLFFCLLLPLFLFLWNLLLLNLVSLQSFSFVCLVDTIFKHQVKRKHLFFLDDRHSFYCRSTIFFLKFLFFSCVCLLWGTLKPQSFNYSSLLFVRSFATVFILRQNCVESISKLRLLGKRIVLSSEKFCLSRSA